MRGTKECLLSKYHTCKTCQFWYQSSSIAYIFGEVGYAFLLFLVECTLGSEADYLLDSSSHWVSVVYLSRAENQLLSGGQWLFWKTEETCNYCLYRLCIAEMRSKVVFERSEALTFWTKPMIFEDNCLKREVNLSNLRLPYQHYNFLLLTILSTRFFGSQDEIQLFEPHLLYQQY